MFYTKCSEKFRKSHGIAFALESLFESVHRKLNLKKLRHRYFAINFAKIFRAATLGTLEDFCWRVTCISRRIRLEETHHVKALDLKPYSNVAIQKCL